VSIAPATGGSQALINKHADAIARALKRWKAAPARSGGAAIASTIEAPLFFLSALPTGGPEAARVTKLRPLKQADTEYPEELEKERVRGSAIVEFTLDEKGRPQNPVVLYSAHSHFDKSALETIRRYRFQKPDLSLSDTRGNIPRAPSDGRWQYELFFAPNSAARIIHRSSSLPGIASTSVYPASGALSAPMVVPSGIMPAIYPLTEAEMKQRPGTILRGRNVVEPILEPEVLEARAPVYPPELLRQKISGSATVRAYANPEGRIVYLQNVGATQDAFARALHLAVSRYKLKAPEYKGRAVASILTVTHGFQAGNP
jgi:TonB family protein